MKRAEKAGLIVAGVAAVVVLAVLAGTANGKQKDKNKYPYAWGMLTDNTGCVIFTEARHKHTRFVGAVEVRWDGTLDVLEQRNYEMKQKQWKETRKELDALQALAMKDKLKLVKIPEKHTDQELQQARDMCASAKP